MKPQNLAALIGGCLASACFLLVPPASAQVRVAPMLIEAEADRGQAQGVIEVANPGETSAHITVYASPFTYGDSGFVELESDPFDLSPYLFFSPQELVLEPGQQRRIRLSSRLLPSLPDGEYRAVIFVRNQEPMAGEIDGVRVNIVPRIGVLFFVRKGNTSVEIVPQSANVDIAEHQLDLLVSNQGTASIQPSVRWTLSQNDTPVRSGETNQMIVLAGEERTMPIDYGADLASGTYQLAGDIVGGSLTVPFTFEITIP